MSHAAAKTELTESVLAALPPEGASRQLAPLLLARASTEDLASLGAPLLAEAARRGAALFADRRAGEATVSVEPIEAPLPEPVVLVTVVHDDMAFLFDSVLAEINERTAAVHLIAHPILLVEPGADGAPARFRSARGASPAGGNEARVSLIQVVADDPGPDGREALARNLRSVLGEARAANADFEAMRDQVLHEADTLETRAASRADADAAIADEEREAAALLRWLSADNFIFLGTRRLDYHTEGEALRAVPGASLGILRDPAVRVLRRETEGGETGAEIRAFLEGPAPLVVAKGNARSRVHRRAYMDYVGVKLRDAAGALIGELRIAGLFASAAYTQPVARIPFLRRKVETVVERLGFSPRSHSAKALRVVLETYSRDELFQIDVDLLQEFADTITELGERPRIRVLPRIDRFDRFVSVLVFVPRERYDARLRDSIGALLAERYEGHVSAYYPAFPEGALATIHFIIGRRGGRTPEPDPAELESAVAVLARDWKLGFERAARGEPDAGALLTLAPGLPGSYREAVGPEDAVRDARYALQLSPEHPLALDFARVDTDGPEILRLRIYHLGEPMTLSRRVPILENMGFSAVAERTFDLARADGARVFLHEMALARRGGGAVELAGDGAALEATFLAVADGRIENDAFNGLVQAAGLDWRAANVLRAYGRYLRQTGFASTPEFIASVLERLPGVARDLFALFRRFFDPADAAPADAIPADLAGDRDAELCAERGALAILLAIRRALDEVSSLDDDRVARRLLGAVLATLRTNHFALPDLPSADPASRPDAVAPALAFKLDPHRLEGVPPPVPFREIFVFDARVEGVHLRFGPVARGGLRWSDRSQDYRTEVLGLVKAQQVKNAVIVPVGSKGGFYPKQLPDPAVSRDAWFEAGRSAYVVFIASLLSVTDNIEADGTTTHPDGVLARDDLDPYFVVAADKGTATFSDTANAVAQARGFWLDDAFASGGSAGYDHKAIGITARGAWEAVKRHFREMGTGERAWDIQREPFTAAGCGDMSGDVFGNGMLLSKETRLVAAFDHRDIFIDPNPDAAHAFAERQRLFDLPRSSWADYDKALISGGGGVFSRRAKRIELSREAAEAIGWDRRAGTPAEVISAILRAPVDLLWFGGIGTYVRASTESQLDVGDRGNDAVRITARELRAKVVGEGANLGFTQSARIEAAAKAGVRLNTDAIDNSAGVNTSDVEVNIKIALRAPLAAGRLARPERDRVLAAMTPDVAALVLRNNYDQTLALSLEQRAGPALLPLQSRMMTALEETGALDREVETLPNEARIADLRARGQGLTRPELAVLLAYAKIDLFNRILAGTLPDDPYLEASLLAYFPPAMRDDFRDEILGHRLRREIVGTGLANDLVNRLGSPFVTALRDATGRSAGHIAAAFVVARDGFGADALFDRIDALDNALPGTLQNELYEAVSLFLRGVTGDLARDPLSDLGGAVSTFRSRLADVRPRLTGLSSERARADGEARAGAWRDRGVPEDLANDLAALPLLALLPDVERVSRETGSSFTRTLTAYFALTQRLRIGRLEASIAALRPADYYEILALERAGSQIARERRRLLALALGRSQGPDPVEDWAETEGEALRSAADRLAQLAGTGETSVARLTLAAGLLQDLGR